MNEYISHSYPVARKEYHDDSYEWIMNWLEGCGRRGTKMTFSELRWIVQRKYDWKIHKGEKYRKYTGKYDGEIYTTRESIKGAEVCKRLNLYQE